MSIPVALEELVSAVSRYGPSPYLLTVGSDGRPHAVAVAIRWSGQDLVASVGRRTAANAEARPLVSLVWAPVEVGVGGYSLIVDGDASVTVGAEGAEVFVVPTKAVLHRAAPQTGDGTTGCGSDCVPLTTP